MKTAKSIIAALICLAGVSLCQAEVIEPNQYAIWGIGDDQINIPVGSVVTEAVLTISGCTSADAAYVHLLDDTDKGLAAGLDAEQGDYFAGYGVQLQGVAKGGNLVFRFSQNNDIQSPMWAVYPNPFVFTLADGSSVQYSSCLLQAMDYIGNGRGFGIGVDSAADAPVVFDSLKLELTVETYQGAVSTKTLTFAFPDMATVPVAWWKMDDNSSNYSVMDSSGNNTGVGTRNTSGMTALGVISNALSFNGLSDYVDCGDSPSLQERNTLTVSAWVNAADFAKPYNMIICGDKGNLDFSWGLRIDNGTLRFFVRTGGYYLAQGPALSAGKWYHVAGVWDRNGGANNLRVYVNGQLAGQNTVNRDMDASPVRVNIARAYFPGVNQYFKGLIDNVKFYNKTLSEVEIDSLYAEGAAGTNQAPILASIGNKTAYEGVRLSSSIYATDPDGDSLTYSALNLPAGAVLDSKTGLLTWTPAVGQQGLYSITIQVTDNGYGNLTSSEIIIITVKRCTTDGLIAFWMLDDNVNSNLVVDSSGNNNTGISARNTSVMTTTGALANALSFNGLNDYVDCGDSPILQERNNLTILAWVNAADFAKPYNMIICGDKGNLDFSWGLRIDNGTLRFFVRTGGYCWAQGPALSAGKWYHVVGVWDRNGGANNLRVYVNGQLAGQNTVNYDMDASPVRVNIARVYFPGVNQSFKGQIDNTRMYNRVLSADEILDLYYEGAAQ